MRLPASKLCCGFALLLTVSASAQVPYVYEEVGYEKGVPPDLLFAIARAESQYATTAGLLPWPWAINHRGTPHFFKNKWDAVEFADDLIAQGDYQFDIGLAQMNWRWHRDRFFDDPATAIDPRKNLSAAADFLKEQRRRKGCKSWALAIGCYHRPSRDQRDRAIADAYALRVLEIWETL